MQSNRGILRQSAYFDPMDLAGCWPPNTPLLILGGSGRYSVVPTHFEAVPPAQWISIPILGSSVTPDRVDGAPEGFPFISGYIAVLAYDDLANLSQSTKIKFETSKVYRVSKALVFDHKCRSIWQTWDDCPNFTSTATRPDTGVQRWRIDPLLLADQMCKKVSHFKCPTFELRDWSERASIAAGQSYLAIVAQVQNDIENGRYYQANILRYFLTSGASIGELAIRISRCGGPYSALVADGDFVLASFSPERFILIEPKDVDGVATLVATTEPIKGTASRSANSQEDLAAISQLQSSLKDHAELHIIVDLLRNDLNRISNRQSVKVEDRGSVQSFSHVHHLVAKITSTLQKDISIRSFLGATSPGGSITGAPKVEVMKAIREYEGRDRGFFMGNIICHDRSGRLDSSILIRTMVSSNRGESFEFAAGSGIVMDSKPELELAEITAKCRVVTEML